MFKSINWSSNILLPLHGYQYQQLLHILSFTIFNCEDRIFKPIRSTIPLAITSSFGIWYNCHFKLELPALIAIVLT